jgi:hypothetical protein
MGMGGNKTNTVDSGRDFDKQLSVTAFGCPVHQTEIGGNASLLN